MVKTKFYCDFCGKEIQSPINEMFSVTYRKDISKEETLDLCRDCMQQFSEKIAEMKISCSKSI